MGAESLTILNKKQDHNTNIIAMKLFVRKTEAKYQKEKLLFASLIILPVSANRLLTLSDLVMIIIATTLQIITHK